MASSFFRKVAFFASMVSRATTPIAGTLAATASFVLWLGSPQAAASEATILPFFSKPYPSGYTRPIHDPSLDCWVYRRVETLFGTRVDRIWVCGNTLVERY